MDAATRTIIGVIVGGLLGGAGNLLHSKYATHRTKIALAASLAGEIEAIVQLAEEKGFILELDTINQFDEFRKNPPQAPFIPQIFNTTRQIETHQFDFLYNYHKDIRGALESLLAQARNAIKDLESISRQKFLRLIP